LLEELEFANNELKRKIEMLEGKLEKRELIIEELRKKPKSDPIEVIQLK